MSTYNLCFEQKYEKYQNFLSENFHFLVVRFLVYLNSHVFVMFWLRKSILSRVMKHQVQIFLNHVEMHSKNTHIQHSTIYKHDPMQLEKNVSFLCMF